MHSGKSKYRFESEVHLGLLSIVLVLLLLSLASNFVLFKARVKLQDETTEQLRSAVVVVTRVLQEYESRSLPGELKRDLMRQHRLSGLQLVPSEPAANDPQSRAIWLGEILAQMPASQAPDIVDRLLRAEPNRLTRGDENQFFMVAPVPFGREPMLAIVATRNPDLAFLQDGNQIILWVGAGLTLLAAIGYLALSRFIFRPFRRIKAAAALAGHDVGEINHEADSVVEEFKRVIRELKAKEAELVQLNAAIQSRADSLEQYNEYLLSSIESGIVSLDLDGCIKAINGAALEILGLGGELSGKLYTEIFADDSYISRAVKLALQGVGQTGYREIAYRSGDDRELVLGVAISTVRDATDQSLGVSILVNDLTEVTDLRAQIEQKNRLAALGEMAAGLAHQIRNSVGAIGGFGNLIKRRFARENQPTELVESLLKETREAEDLVSKFLAFARPLSVQPQAISLREMLAEILRGYEVRDDCRHISIEMRGDDIVINGDPLLLKQVLVNLIDNSIIAYDGRQGKIEIGLATYKGTAEIRIQDHGCGIPADRLDKVFTPFYSSRPSGTGLGLPLASRIVDLHGGGLTIESAPGHGTTVTIHLPITASILHTSH